MELLCEVNNSDYFVTVAPVKFLKVMIGRNDDGQLLHQF